MSAEALVGILMGCARILYMYTPTSSHLRPTKKHCGAQIRSRFQMLRVAPAHLSHRVCIIMVACCCLLGGFRLLLEVSNIGSIVRGLGRSYLSRSGAMVRGVWRAVCNRWCTHVLCAVRMLCAMGLVLWGACCARCCSLRWLWYCISGLRCGVSLRGERRAVCGPWCVHAASGKWGGGWWVVRVVAFGVWRLGCGG